MSRTEQEKIDANIRSRILSALRRIWMFYGTNRKDTLLAGRREAVAGSKLVKYEHQCVVCKEWFSQSNIKVDHVVKCGGLSSLGCISGYAERLFKGKCQKLCKTCHDQKTAKERKR